MFAEDGRVRSRMAELTREVRYVKQRFKRDDAGERPYLARSLKIELRDRDKPDRQELVERFFAGLADNVSEVSKIRSIDQRMGFDSVPFPNRRCKTWLESRRSRQPTNNAPRLRRLPAHAIAARRTGRAPCC